MNSTELSKLLKRLHAREEARAWANGKSLTEVWAECKRGDWLLWLTGSMAGKEGWPTRQQVALAACACARTALRFVPEGEPRALQAIETTERWARGEATPQQVRTAAYAAYAAYATTAASTAAYAAAAAAAAYAAYAAYAAAAYAAYARDKALAEMADFVRGELKFAAIEETTHA